MRLGGTLAVEIPFLQVLFVYRPVDAQAAGRVRRDDEGTETLVAFLLCCLQLAHELPADRAGSPLAVLAGFHQVAP